MREVVSACILLSAISLPLRAQAPNDTARILSLENAWNGAEATHDVHSLELLISDNFVYTDEDGAFMNKRDWISQIRSETDQYDLLANSGVSVVIYENAAVATGEYREKIKIKGKMVLRSGRFTDTWVRRNGEWKCVASQATLIAR